MRTAIEDGRLPLGSRLPSSRNVATDLGIARGTVVEAYSQLLVEGYLEARHGSGTWVSMVPSARTRSTKTPTPTSTLYDLRPGTPDVSLFPRTQWMAAMRKVLQTAPDAVLGRTENHGRIELRAALANYLGRARGVHADTSRLVIGNGFMGMLPLVLRGLVSMGIRRVFMEDPCIPAHRRIAVAAGLEVVPLPVDDAGARVGLLPRDEPSAAVVTPAHQYPLGGTLHPARRAELVRWAEETRSVVIEDDYDGEFRYDRQPTGALQNIAHERIVYAGSASKTLAPGLRLGWLVLPPTLVQPTLDAKRDLGAHAGVLEQLTLAEFIESGSYDRHVRKARQVYRHRRDFLLEALESRARGRTIKGIPAGLHVVLELPPGVSEESVLDRAREHSIALQVLGPTWHAGGDHPQAIVLGLAAPPAHAFQSAIRALVEVLDDFG